MIAGGAFELVAHEPVKPRLTFYYGWGNAPRQTRANSLDSELASRSACRRRSRREAYTLIELSISQLRSCSGLVTQMRTTPVGILVLPEKGKTVVVANLVPASTRRCQPSVFVDGKGR